MRAVFIAVASRKPGASRGDSTEMYLVGKGLKGRHWSLNPLGLRMDRLWQKRKAFEITSSRTS